MSKTKSFIHAPLTGHELISMANAAKRFSAYLAEPGFTGTHSAPDRDGLPCRDAYVAARQATHQASLKSEGQIDALLRHFSGVAPRKDYTLG